MPPYEEVIEGQPHLDAPIENIELPLPPPPSPAMLNGHPQPSLRRISNAPANEAVQQQSYRTESSSSPSSAKAAPAASAPRGSRPVPKRAGSPPGLLPNVSPAPQRLPTTTGGQKPTAAVQDRSAPSGFSSVTKAPQVQPVKEIKQTGGGSFVADRSSGWAGTGAGCSDEEEAGSPGIVAKEAVSERGT